MSTPASLLVTDGSLGQVTLESAHRFFAWLGAVTLNLFDQAALMLAQGNQEMAQVEASSEFGAPAILMAGGLATLSILFAVMLVRKTPPATSSGPSGGSHPSSAPVAQASGPPQAVSAPEAPAAPEAASADERPAPDPKDPDVPVVTAEVDETDEEVTLALSTAGSLGTTQTASSRRSSSNGHRGSVDDRSSRVLASGNAEHQDLLKRGRRAGAGFNGTTMDDLMEHMRETGIAEPRVLKTVPHLVRIRLVHCRGCTSGSETSAEGVKRCPFEEGFLEGAFQQLKGKDVVVRETACRQRGDPGCDFEVWF